MNENIKKKATYEPWLNGLNALVMFFIDDLIESGSNIKISEEVSYKIIKSFGGEGEKRGH